MIQYYLQEDGKIINNDFYIKYHKLIINTNVFIVIV